MAVTFVGCNSGGGTQGTSTTAGSVAWPSGLQAGDLALLWCAATSGTYNTPSGFSVLKTAVAITGDDTAFFRKYCTGTETGSVSLTVNASSNACPVAILIVFRGVDQTTPMDVDAAIATSTTASTTVATSSVTNTNTNNALVAFFSGGVTSSTTTSTWTEAATVGTIIEPTNGDVERHSTTNTMSMSVCYVLNAAASATSVTGTRSVTSSAKAAYLGFIKAQILVSDADTGVGTDTGSVLKLESPVPHNYNMAVSMAANY